jgi:hypothetical protein
MRAGPAWEFFVGPRSAATDTSWGTAFDVNGDGFADAAIAAPGALGSMGRVLVFLGSSAGLDSTPSVSIPGPPGSNGGFGAALANAGDVNGDGYADLLIGDRFLDGSTGRAYIHFGGPGGPSAAAGWSVGGPDGPMGYFGEGLSAAGDLNGDGYADVAIGAPRAASQTGRVHVFYGSSSGPASSPDWSMTGPEVGNSQFGKSISSSGDINGDGYGDLAIGAPNVGNAGIVHIFQGSGSGLGSAPTISLPPVDGPYAQFGERLALAGDVNGDGLADLIVASQVVGNFTGAAYIFWGSASGISMTPALTLRGPDGMNGHFGVSISSGDLDGDGFGDAVIGATSISSMGHVFVYRGGTSGTAATPSFTITGRDAAGSAFGSSVSSGGDSTGDSFTDLVVGAPGVSMGLGRAYAFSGSAAGPSTTPASTLTGTDASGAFGGSVVCGTP